MPCNDRAVHRPLDGRVALVTGASRRIAIGAAIARRLVSDGASVMVHSWSPHDDEQPWGSDPGGAEALVRELRGEGGHVEHVAADFADPQAPADLVSSTCEAFGRLDVVVANHARSSAQALEQLTAPEIDLTYAVNTRATLLLVQAFAARYDGRRGAGWCFLLLASTTGPCPANCPTSRPRPPYAS